MQGHPFFIQPAGEHLPGQVNFLLAFGKRDDRKVRPSPSSAPSAAVSWPFSAIDNDQIRERCIFFDEAVITPFHDLGDRCKVVDSFDGLDLETAGNSSCPAAPSRNCTIDPTMDVPERWEISKHSMTSGECGKAKAGLQVFYLQLVFHEGVSDIFLHKFDQLLLLTHLRDGHLDGPSFPF